MGVLTGHAQELERSEQMLTNAVDAVENCSSSALTDEVQLLQEQEQLATLQMQNNTLQQEKTALERNEDARLCVVCIDSQYTVAMLPCGHVCMCEQCAVRFSQDVCPQCRAPIEDTMRVLM